MSSPTTRREFVRTVTAATGAIAASRLTSLLAGTPAPVIMAYVGTYSSPLKKVPKGQVDLPAGNGRGIHLFRMDRATGALSPAGLFEMPTSPSALAVNGDGTRLYSANETDKLGDDDAGSVSAFEIDSQTGELKLINTVSSGGAGPAHLSVHPSGKFVLVANYFGGSVAVLPIQPGGGLGAATDIKKAGGEVGPKKATNAPPGSFAFSGHETPHAHMIATDPSRRFVLSSDLGLDRLLVWKLDEQRGVLTPNDPAGVSLPPGDGPRHFAFHHNHQWLYSLQEEGSTIVLFDWDAKAGRLTGRQTISSLQPGFAGSNFTSEIALSPNGRFVYAANRLHDTIAWFTVGADGALTYAGEEPTRGDYPRYFGFDPTGSFVFSCNQRADNITAFRADGASGALTFTGQYTAVGNPSTILFVELQEPGVRRAAK